MMEHVFRPANSAQRGFLEATEPELLYSGAFGAGKSRVGCEKALFLSQHYPGNVGLICRKYFSDLRSTTLTTLFEEVLPDSHIIKHHKTEHYIDVVTRDASTPSRIWYRGIDRPTGIGSMNLGWVFIDEGIEITQDDWAMLTGRLRLNRVPFHQIFTATNPGAPSHWMYEHFYRDAKPGIRRAFQASAFDNPHTPESYKERLRRFTGVHRERFVEGRWVGYEGIVYPEYYPLTHIVEPFEIPPSWRRVRVIDFGTNNPFVCQWWAQDPRDATWYMYREIYMTNRRATEHGRQILTLSGSERFETTISDHDAGDRLDLESLGIKTRPANKNVDEGLQAVMELLSRREDVIDATHPKGKPGALFFRDALVEVDPRLKMEGKPYQTVDEFGGYRWATGIGGSTKDVPVKINDHGMDALRYLAVYVSPRAKHPRTFGVG